MRLMLKYQLKLIIFIIVSVALVAAAYAANKGSDIELLPDMLSIKDMHGREGIFFGDQNGKKAEFMQQIMKGYSVEEQTISLKGITKKIYINSNIKMPVVEFKKVNPVKYRIRIHNAVGDFPLILNESYHDGWNAYINSREMPKIEDEKQLKQYKILKNSIQNNNLPNGRFYETWGKKAIPDDYHWVANGFANSWWIVLEQIKKSKEYKENPDGSIDFEIILEFWPQRIFYLGLFISCFTLFGCLAYLIYNRIKHGRSIQ